jgi:hypothetical protein
MRPLWMAAAVMIASGTVHAQTTDTDDAAANAQAATDALSAYYGCARDYALRYATTPALSGDIADAAMSACQPQLTDYVNTASKVPGNPVPESLGNAARVYARDLAVRTALEAKYSRR